jgi:hypothetical protein
LLKFAWKKPNTKENFMEAAYNALPQFVQKIIQTSDEWAELMGGSTVQAGATPAATVASGDDLPF